MVEHCFSSTVEHTCSRVVLHCRLRVATQTCSVVVLHWRLVSVLVTGTWIVLHSVDGSSQHFSSQTVLQTGAMKMPAKDWLASRGRRNRDFMLVVVMYGADR